MRARGLAAFVAPYRQSERNDLYAAALKLFDDNGLVFKCVCSRKDIRMAASAPHGKTPKYPGTCRLENARFCTTGPIRLALQGAE